MKKLYLISNDKIYCTKRYYTSNNDLNNIITCLNGDYKIHLISRKSLKKYDYLITKKFKLADIKDVDEDIINVLMISITPFNFLTLMKLIYLGKKLRGFVYLRSDGFLEYQIRYGILGYYAYFFMFFVIKKYLKILSCSKNFTHVKLKKILHPSELTANWFKKKIDKNSFKTDFLYVGRFKKEKGIIYFIDIFKKYLKNYNLTIVGTKKEFIHKKYYNKNINFINPITNTKKMINLYDSTKIFILPSYTEGFPKVISESLARLKPIIIFEEIKHVLNNRYGIFVCKRDNKNLTKMIDYILRNYKNIQKKIIKNNFYTKDDFKKELLRSIKNEFKN
tara:strand:+ start:9120 stop:10124 length:1005 start_codon:yes stop_codon:yes gene_type:complete